MCHNVELGHSHFGLGKRNLGTNFFFFFFINALMVLV